MIKAVKSLRFLRQLLGIGIVLLFVIWSSWNIFIDDVNKHLEPTGKQKFDVIVVLGARAYVNGAYNPCLYARAKQGALLYSTGQAKKIMVTGGNDREDGQNESAVMMKMLKELKIPPSVVLMESKATSTYQNLLFSQDIMKKNKMKTAIFVSEYYHLPRVGKVAEKLGIQHALSQAGDSACWNNWKYLSYVSIREMFAYIYYLSTEKI